MGVGELPKSSLINIAFPWFESRLLAFVYFKLAGLF